MKLGILQMRVRFHKSRLDSRCTRPFEYITDLQNGQYITSAKFRFTTRNTDSSFEDEEMSIKVK
jgi:hypothetical protein